MSEKILVIAERVPFPSDNGGKLRTANTLIQLAKHYDIDFAVYSQDIINDAQYEIMNKICSNVYTFAEGRPGYIKHLKHFFTGKSGIACGIYSTNMQKKIDELIEHNNYKMIWVERLFCMPYVQKRLSKKGNNPPVILNMHDVDSEAVAYFAKVDVSTIKRIYYKFEYKRVVRLEKKSFKNVKRIIACSKRDQEIYVEKFPFSKEKWLVANNGVDLSIARNLPVLERDDNTVLFIGGLDNPCNRDGLIWFIDNVWDKVLQKIDTAQLIIAGSGKSADQIKQKADTKKNTYFLGYVNDINPLYQKSTCIIVPIHSGSGTRLKIVEAFSFRMPVVSTSIGAEGLPVSSGEELIIADKPEEFADGIYTLLTDKALCEKFVDKAYKVVVDYYDWDIIMSKAIEEVEKSI